MKHFVVTILLTATISVMVLGGCIFCVGNTIICHINKADCQCNIDKELAEKKTELKDVERKFDEYYKELKEVEHKEGATEIIIPDGYVPLNECIPIQDIDGYFYDKDDYLCFEIGDIGNQLENPENWTYENIIRRFDLPHLEELEK